MALTKNATAALTWAQKKAMAEARKAEAEAKMMEQRSADRQGMKDVFHKDIGGAGPQKEMRKLQTGAMKDISSGAAARRGAEAGLRAQIAGAGGRPGGAAAKRALSRAGEAGVMGAGAQVAGSAAQVAGLAGKVRGEDVGIGKADKTARMKFQQLRMGEELAREGMKAQVSAASAGRSCFIAGTMVVMADGSKKKIEHILVGEKVLGLDNRVNTVLEYNRPPTAGRSLYSINDGKAFITHEHPLYTLKGWKAVNPLATFEELKPTEDLYPELLETTSLEIGDELVTVDGLVKVESIKEYEAEFFTQLYNFLLDGDHTYFADGYLVHNGGKAAGGEMLKRLSGSYTHKNGKIKGPGTETSDSIKARLSDGEFVVNAKTVRGIGESLGAKGKHPSRQKGSAYLYALQSKYGDKKAKSPKGLIPGFFSGAHVAQLAQGVASSGLLGKKLKVAGDVAGAGMAAHEAGVKAKSAKAAKVESAALAKKTGKAADITIQGAKTPTPAGQENAPKVVPGMIGPEAVGIRETKSIMKKPADQKQHDPRFTPEPEPEKKKVGGEIKFGKGVKVRKKFLDSIGHKPFKHFEDKAEKDYKEGQTGYKNLKKRQKSTVPGFDFGISAGIAIASAAAAAAKAEADRKRAARKADRDLVTQAGIEGGKSLASSAQGIMKQDTELESGGSVIDRPKLNVEKLLKEPLGKEYRLPEHGDDIDAPYKKKLEPRSTKKPPPWMRKKEKPIKMEKGGEPVSKYESEGVSHRGFIQAMLEGRPYKGKLSAVDRKYLEKDWKEMSKEEKQENRDYIYSTGPHSEKAIMSGEGPGSDKAGKLMEEAGKKPFYGYKKRGQKEGPDMKKHRKSLEGKVPKKWKDMTNDEKWNSLQDETRDRKKYIKSWEDSMGKKLNPLQKAYYMENKKEMLPPIPKDKKSGLPPKPKGQDKFKLDPAIPGMVKKLVGRKIEPKKIKFLPKILKEKSIVEKKIKGESVLDRLHKKNLKFPQKKPKRFISKLDEEKAKGMKKFKPFGKDPGFGKPISEEARKKLPKGPLAIKGEEIKKKILEKRKQMAPVSKSSLVYRPDDKRFKKAPAIPRELQLEKGVPVEQLEEQKKIKVKKLKKRIQGRDKRDLERKAHSEWEGKDKEREDKIDWSNPGVRKFYISQGRGKEIPEKLKTSTDRNLMAKRVWAKRRKEYKKEDPRSVIGKLGDVLHTGKTSAWGDRTVKEKQEQARLKAKPKPKKLISPEEQEPRGAKDKRSFLDKITGGDKAEAKRLGMDVETYKRAKKKVGKGTGLFGATEEDIRKGAASEKPKVAPKPKVVAPKVPGVKIKDEPGVKKKKPEGMTDKEWANMGLAAGLTGLKAIAKSKQDAAAARKADKDLMTKARMAGGQSLSDFGGKVMQANMNLKKGGKVSFKDVLKAKKKMGY